MPTDVMIRAMRPDTRPDWAAFWDAYLAFYEASVPEAVYDSTFSRLLGEDPQDFSCFVAERGRALVGLTHYLFYRHAWKIENVCYLQDLYATLETRGTGVGRAMIEAVYAEAGRQGAPSVYWLTQDFNATARQLYDQIGTLIPFIRYQRP